MQICTRCLYKSDHPLNLIFDDEGICSGCRVHEEKDLLDWNERVSKLIGILNNYRSLSGKNYDCIIPVSGARDSYFTVHMIKNIFRMNPLLVCYNKHYNTALGVQNLANLRLRFNCDIMTLTVNPETVKRITRSTLRRFGSMYWHCLAGQSVYPVQIAIKLKIPLIIWGVHQGVDQVGMFSHMDEVEMTRKYRKEHDLMGFEAEDLVNNFDNLNESDLIQYFYPDDRELEQVGVRGIYLSNYIRWDSRIQHEQMIREYGYQTAQQTRTFDTYSDVDCWNYSDVHDYIKWIKYGYGKVTDHACREIRLHHMTRAQGISMINYYESREPHNLDLFLEWLGITENAFNYIIDQHRNPVYWERNKNWKWQFRSDLLPEYSGISGPKKELPVVGTYLPFKLTNPKNYVDNTNKYILIGKGIY
jgi:N-acetyl sugar amidotransferase